MAELKRYREGRQGRPRSRTLGKHEMTLKAVRAGAVAYPEIEGVKRPKTRGECRDAQRPCPWVACKYSLYIDVNPETGTIKLNYPYLEPHEMEQSCALDVADRGGITLEEVAKVTNLVRERIRQIEVRSLLKLKMTSSSGASEGLGEIIVEELTSKRRAKRRGGRR